MGDAGQLQHFLFSILIVLVSLTIHELAHAKAAEVAGDSTARLAGRISLNPFDHLDPMGTIMMITSSWFGIGIGWAKPVPVNPALLKHPRWDSLKISLWGPLSNMLIALGLGMVARFGWQHINVDDLSIINTAILINLGLAVFNLIPIAPLDGSHILSALLPIEQARKYDMFFAKYAMLPLIALVVIAPLMGFPILDKILDPPIGFLFTLFTGLPY